MNISIIVNTRNRISQLKIFCDKLEQHAHSPSEIECLLKCDTDDQPTIDFFETLKNRSIKYHCIVSPRPSNLNASYNEMAKLATGTRIWNLNDDAEINTVGWDKIILNKIENFKSDNEIRDDIIYGMVSDTSVDKPAGKRYASFPILSRSSVEVMGCFFFPEFNSFGGDSCLIRAFEAVGRVVEIPEIVIDHVYHNNIFRVMSPDATAAEMRANSNRIDPFEFNIDKYVNKLKEYINK